MERCVSNHVASTQSTVGGVAAKAATYDLEVKGVDLVLGSDKDKVGALVAGEEL